MLNSGSWPEHRNFWTGFFNPQFLPQVFMRTGGAFLLASLYVYLHASLKVKNESLRNLIGKRSSRPALLGSLLIIFGSMGWFIFLPASSKAALSAASALNILMTLIIALTAVVFVMLYLGPYRNPGWVTPGFAILFLGFGFASMATGEFIREAVRKPYIVYNVVFSNQIYPEELQIYRDEGMLEKGHWLKSYVNVKYPKLLNNGKINYNRIGGLPESDQIHLGKMLFLYSCNSCHSTDEGFAAVAYLTRGWTPDMVHSVAANPDKHQFFMPPWPGNNIETLLLTKYIESIKPEHPAGMNYGTE
ncbi:MAG: hypothetical protein A2161_09575 [Candidatus Schekmanbacteria bacterium RBG_13_48_7]|uniref:Cytochrome c domain-containing protein n=1 Tax=Candidatus Schekmanbacteria bacterium RBG_13_48_7 TaxID=1817878 RepID=A0A1F7RNU1_9BACT|nr:MAG: hypothetical protein A2161_09575 [Candidatus Schekmanbacteria bacterium RBG_13_48_7]